MVSTRTGSPRRGSGFRFRSTPTTPKRAGRRTGAWSSTSSIRRSQGGDPGEGPRDPLDDRRSHDPAGDLPEDKAPGEAPPARPDEGAHRLLLGASPFVDRKDRLCGERAALHRLVNALA